MSKKAKALNIETASRDELVTEIVRLRASRDSIREHNKHITKYADRVRESVYSLAIDGSLAFQAMAEKADVRGHPSVTAAVRYFDTFAGLQWGKDEAPKIEFPDGWDFEGSDSQWSGDADMQLNAPIADLIELIEHLRFKLPLDAMPAIAAAISKVQSAMVTHIDGIKSVHGFAQKTVTVRDAPNGIGWAILDLAQDMSFANEMLRRDLRAAAYRRICADLYGLSQCEFAEGPEQINIKVLGGEIPL